MVSCLASVVPSGNHVKDCTLPILQKLRDALRAAELCYCQWKGHWKPFLESVTPGPLFPVSAPEFEFIIFVIRAVLGYSARDLVRPAQSGADTVAQNEFTYLRARIDRAALHTLLERHLPFLDSRFFDRCARSLVAPTSAMRRLRLRDRKSVV